MKNHIFALLLACFALGGSSVYAQSVAEIRAAAEQGDANAQNLLGFKYKDGDGVTKDEFEAVKWWRKAAELGHANAQSNLGYCYIKGFGVTADAVEAYKWFKISQARDSSAEARAITGKALAIVVTHMTPEQIAEAEKRVREWKPSVAQ